MHLDFLVGAFALDNSLPGQVIGETMNRNRIHRRDTTSRHLRASFGFSVFELVAFIILASIVYAGAVNRFAQFPGQAERANFLAISTQLKSAINVEMMIGMGTGRIQSPERMVGANPMDLMLEPPSNYLGAFNQLNTAGLQRRVWYFDNSTRELVYLASDPTGLFLIINGTAVPTNEVRFQIQAIYSAHEAGSGLPVSALANAGAPVGAQVAGFDGIALRPTVPFIWNQINPDELIDQALAEQSSIAQN